MKKFLWGFLIFCGIGLLGNLLPKHESSGSRSEPSKTREYTKEASSQVAVDLFEDSCLQVTQAFSTQSNMTDFQKEELWKQYKGKVFQWNLKVTDVSSKLFGGFNLQATCQGSNSLIQDILVIYPKEAASAFKNTRRGDVVKVKGRLKHHIGEILGLSAQGLLE